MIIQLYEFSMPINSWEIVCTNFVFRMPGDGKYQPQAIKTTHQSGLSYIKNYTLYLLIHKKSESDIISKYT